MKAEKSKIDELLAQKIADDVEPRYRTQTGRSYTCSGHVAKRWGAAYEGAIAALRARTE